MAVTTVRKSQRLFEKSVWLLQISVWVSSFLFGLYIFIFFIGTVALGEANEWNNALPNLFRKEQSSANVGIGLHFAFGAILLFLGNIQFVERVRNNYPRIHRFLGRIYIVSAIVTAIGGLVFIMVRGAIGGPVMSIGFALCGVLMLISAISTWYFAVKGQQRRHRAWAMRLYALVISSWLYRIEYGFWFLFTNGIGVGELFDGPFDFVMDFFFYLPNLLVVECILRGGTLESKMKKYLLAGILFLTSLAVVAGTYFFLKLAWIPYIAKVLSTIFS